MRQVWRAEDVTPGSDVMAKTESGDTLWFVATDAGEYIPKVGPAVFCESATGSGSVVKIVFTGHGDILLEEKGFLPERCDLWVGTEMN